MSLTYSFNGTLTSNFFVSDEGSPFDKLHADLRCRWGGFGVTTVGFRGVGGDKIYRTISIDHCNEQVA
jgi:hypothetical protein